MCDTYADKLLSNACRYFIFCETVLLFVCTNLLHPMRFGRHQNSWKATFYDETLSPAHIEETTKFWMALPDITVIINCALLNRRILIAIFLLSRDHGGIWHLSKIFWNHSPTHNNSRFTFVVSHSF